MMRRVLAFAAVVTLFIGLHPPTSVLAQQTDVMERFRQMSARAEAEGLADPFRGVTTNGEVVPGLFPVRSLNCWEIARSTSLPKSSPHDILKPCIYYI